MEDKQVHFTKKGEPFNTESKEKVTSSNFKSLIAKIQSKVSQRTSVLKERPIQKERDVLVPEKKPIASGMKPLPNFNLTSSRLNAINKSLISRISNERGAKQQISATSRLKSRPIDPTSRDRSTLKERINRLSTLERNLKETEVKHNLLTTKKIGSKMPSKPKGALSLLQKFQIHQLKNQPVERSKSSKEGSSSNGTNSALVGKLDSQNIKFNEGLDLLKKRIAQLPSRSAAQIDSPETKTKSTRPTEGKTDTVDSKMIHSIETPGINVNLYKKKVDPLSYKRDEQSSLKILRARRSPDTTDTKRSAITNAGASKIRIKDRETTLN